MTEYLTTRDGTLAYDDTGGSGPLLLLLPGAGDIRSEHRFLGAELADAGYRVVTMDLRGHGESSAAWPEYGVAATAADIVALLRHLDAGPATVVANSFAPAAALWAAPDHADLIAGVVAISPHLDVDASPLQRLAMRTAFRGPVAGPLWGTLYRGWYKENPPADLDQEVARLRHMLRDGRRRKAARETLLADRDGLAAKLARLEIPVLVIFGDTDDHFSDPAAAAADAATRTGADFELVSGAGHYPHVERPELVAKMIHRFLRTG